MRTELSVVAATAIKRTVTSVSECSPRPMQATIPDSSDRDWFVEMARSLLGKDAGLALHLITGFEERTCYRYTAGDTKPPAYVLRALLRSEQGQPFLHAIMDGCEARWWTDLCNIKQCADAYENERRKIAAL